MYRLNGFYSQCGLFPSQIIMVKQNLMWEGKKQKKQKEWGKAQKGGNQTPDLRGKKTAPLYRESSRTLKLMADS